MKQFSFLFGSRSIEEYRNVGSIIVFDSACIVWDSRNTKFFREVYQIWNNFPRIMKCNLFFWIVIFNDSRQSSVQFGQGASIIFLIFDVFKRKSKFQRFRKVRPIFNYNFPAIVKIWDQCSFPRFSFSIVIFKTFVDQLRSTIFHRSVTRLKGATVQDSLK